MDNVVTKER